jgi:gliding motility associated protien GldN
MRLPGLLYCLVVCLCILQHQLYAQEKPIPNPTIREADVLVSKRVWRVIDLREKQNYKAIWKGSPLNKILYEAVLNNQLIAYRNDSLKSSFSLQVFKMIGGDTLFVQNIIDPNEPDITRTDTVIETMDPEKRIKHVMVMEELIFNQKYSTSSIRIIAIAPLYRLKFAGEDVGLTPLCWLKYNDRFEKETDCRDILKNRFIFNKENSRSTFSFDDWFEQRQFNSFIVKESNQWDLSIMDDPEVKRNGLHALIEAARIKQEQFEQHQNNFEE